MDFEHPQDKTVAWLQSQKSHWSRHWPYIVSTTVFFLISVHLVLTRPPPAPHWGFASGYQTDLDAAFSAIQLQTVTFTGGLFWNDNGTLVRNPLPGGGTEWVGPPNVAMDRLWQRVADAAGIALTGRDAHMVKGLTKQRPSGEYVTGLDVFHQLHCLDRIRQALHPEHYTDPDGHHINSLHMDHCIDYLRQAIMCNGDMTPVHVHHWESVDRWSPDFENTHTCRNFDKLLRWSLERLHPESEEYWRSGKGSPDWQWG